MKRWTNVVWAAGGGARPFGRAGIRPGRRRKLHRQHQWHCLGRPGRRASRRDRDATSPAQIGELTVVTNEAGVYRFPSVPPGEYRISYELAGFQNVVPRGRADHARVQRAGERLAGGRDAAGDRDGQRPVAGHRYVGDAYPDQLRPDAAGVAPERARHVVAARQHALHHAEPRGRGRLDDGHADHLFRVWLLRARTGRSSRASTPPRAPRPPGSTWITARSKRCSSAPRATRPRCRTRAC